MPDVELKHQITEIGATEDENEDQVEEVETQEPTEEPESEPSEEGTVEEPEEEDVSFDEEKPEEEKEDTPVIRNMRKLLKEAQREAKEAKREAERLKSSQVKPEDDPKPKLKDFDYDEEAYEKARDEWAEREAKRNEVENQKNKAFMDKKEAYTKARESTKLPGFADNEREVFSTLSPAQQAILIHAAKGGPERIIQALGKAPERLKSLAAIEDPILFGAELRELELTLKSKTAERKPAQAEETFKGSPPTNNSYEKQLAKLEKEADATGDRSKILAFKKAHKKG